MTVAGIAAAAVALGAFAAHAARHHTPTTATAPTAAAGTAGTAPAATGVGAGAGVAEDRQSPAVEDYAYPDADAILAARVITLISGDGRILLADCAPGAVGQIALRSTRIQGAVCFTVRGVAGELTLSITEVYSIKGDGHFVTATISIDGDTSTPTTIRKNEWTPVNAGDGATLLELKAWT